MSPIRTHLYPEIKAIFTHWLIWFSLASQDIRLRYRRSMIGPFWITISMAVTTGAMGLLYGRLFHTPLDHYFPYLASGIIGWSFLSALLLESSQTYIESESHIKNQASFLSLFTMRLITRNLIILLHNLLVFIPIALFFKTGLGLNLLLLIPGLLILCCNAVFYGTLLAMLGTRYRDFSPIISSTIQIVFFITPIMWMPSALPESAQWVVTYNPFNHFLNLIRAPLLNQSLSLESMLIIFGITCIGFCLYCLYLPKYRQRIVFWL